MSRKVTTTEPTIAAMKAELAELAHANATLAAANATLAANQAKAKGPVYDGLSLKVSVKGGLSVYGLGRFPVTLYSDQWRRLLDIGAEIDSFIAANASVLKEGRSDAEKAAAKASYAAEKAAKATGLPF